MSSTPQKVQHIGKRANTISLREHSAETLPEVAAPCEGQGASAVRRAAWTPAPGVRTRTGPDGAFHAVCASQGRVSNFPEV